MGTHPKRLAHSLLLLRRAKILMREGSLHSHTHILLLKGKGHGALEWQNHLNMVVTVPESPRRHCNAQVFNLDFETQFPNLKSWAHGRTISNNHGNLSKGLSKGLSFGLQAHLYTLQCSKKWLDRPLGSLVYSVLKSGLGGRLLTAQRFLETLVSNFYIFQRPKLSFLSSSQYYSIVNS